MTTTRRDRLARAVTSAGVAPPRRSSSRTASSPKNAAVLGPETLEFATPNCVFKIVLRRKNHVQEKELVHSERADSVCRRRRVRGEGGRGREVLYRSQPQGNVCGCSDLWR